MTSRDPDTPLEATAEYRWLQDFKRAHGRELRERFGADAIGIGWKTTGGEVLPVPALRFYVRAKGPPGAGRQRIPPYFEWRPAGAAEPVRLQTDVIEAEPDSFE